MKPILAAINREKLDLAEIADQVYNITQTRSTKNIQDSTNVHKYTQATEIASQ